MYVCWVMFLWFQILNLVRKQLVSKVTNFSVAILYMLIIPRHSPPYLLLAKCQIWRKWRQTRVRSLHENVTTAACDVWQWQFKIATGCINLEYNASLYLWMLTMFDTRREYLKNRVYYAARDGMAMPMYTLLSELPKEQVNGLLNEVSGIQLFVLCSVLARGQVCRRWLGKMGNNVPHWL